MVEKKKKKTTKKKILKTKKSKVKTKEKKSTKKTKGKTKSTKTKGKKLKNEPSSDMGIIIVDDDLSIDKEKEIEERKAYLEEARSQEAFD